MQYRGIILDIDGTLVDSNEAHVLAWVEVLRAHGFAVTDKDIWPLVGMGGDNLLPRVTGIETDSEEGRTISLRPDEVLMVGDTPYDIQAASPAGVKVVAFRSGGFKDEDLKGALAIYDGAADLLERYDSSPLA